MEDDIINGHEPEDDLKHESKVKERKKRAVERLKRPSRRLEVPGTNIHKICCIIITFNNPIAAYFSNKKYIDSIPTS